MDPKETKEREERMEIEDRRLYHGVFLNVTYQVVLLLLPRVLEG